MKQNFLHENVIEFHCHYSPGSIFIDPSSYYMELSIPIVGMEIPLCIKTNMVPIVGGGSIQKQQLIALKECVDEALKQIS